MNFQHKAVSFLLVLGLFFTLSLPVVSAQEALPYQNPELSVEARVEDLLARMSLAEKIGQMTLVEKNSLSPRVVTSTLIGGVLSGGGGTPSPNTPESWAAMVDAFQQAALDTPLAIPMIYGVDAVHGHGNLRGATIFPQQIGLGAANDPELVEQIGRATALEMIATGIYWNYAPVVAVPQDIRWGRTYEAYGENTELVSRLAVAYINGLQGSDLNDPLSVLATPKHYVGDGGAVWGTSPFGTDHIDRGITDIDEATLRAIHLPPYQAALDAGSRIIMASFSSWGGLHMHAQDYLINDVLKGEMGFTGFVVSDWAGIDQIDPNYRAAVADAINAGIDMNMVPQDYNRFISTLVSLVQDGDVPMERIDDAVRRILRVKFEMGLFEQPFSDSSLLEAVGSEQHRAIARQAVAESLVLLKNDGAALPLAKDTPTILVGGAAADDIGIQSGGWTIEWQGKPGDITPGTTILQGIQAAVGADTQVIYDEDGEAEIFADVAIAVVGERPYAEYEGDDADLSLSAADTELIQQLRARSNHLVVVLLSGRPLVIDSALNTADAFVAAWLPGTEGSGVADVLFGDLPFTGKLPFTWLRTIDQLPFDFASLPTEGCAAPLFPYGYGLDAETSASPYLDLAAECADALDALPVLAQAAPTPVPDAPPDLLVDDFSDALWMGSADGAGIGFVPWGDTFENVTLSQRLLAPGSALALPVRDDGSNNVLAIAYDLGSWGGFTHAFTDGSAWTSQDWTAHNAVSFWLYGNDTGGTVQFEIFDNRNPQVSSDTAERWFYRLSDDYSGWRQFTIPFALFQRRTDFQPDGAPDDGLGLNEVSGYAIGFPVGVEAQTAYLDDVTLTTLADTSELVTTAEIAAAPAQTVEIDESITYDSREWTLVWSDEFEGEAGTPVNSDNWTAEIGGNGWGNNELQYYTNRLENAALDGEGSLAITARQESLGNACHYGLCDYTSARLISANKVELTYGRIEARIRVPRGQGIWPAFWMLGDDIFRVGWPRSGEIDIMENIGREPRIAHGTVHGPGYSGGEGISGSYSIDADFADDFHVFTLDWDPNVLRWYVDGDLYHVVTPDDLNGDAWVFDHDFFLLLNVAVGGNWPGMPDDTIEFPQTMLVDYVRVYTLAGE